MDQQIRSNTGILLGVLRDLGNGRTEARNAKGNLLGHYDAKANATRNANGTLIAQGNVLASLIYR